MKVVFYESLFIWAIPAVLRNSDMPTLVIHVVFPRARVSICSNHQRPGRSTDWALRHHDPRLPRTISGLFPINRAESVKTLKRRDRLPHKGSPRVGLRGFEPLTP